MNMNKSIIYFSLSVEGMLCCAAILWTVSNRSSSCCALIHVCSIKPVMWKNWLYSVCVLEKCAIYINIINLGVFTSGSAGDAEALFLSSRSSRMAEVSSSKAAVTSVTPGWGRRWGWSEQLSGQIVYLTNINYQSTTKTHSVRNAS